MSMTLPRISIVTPSYNQAQYIGWTVRSVLLQRYPDLEYIVMDGGSNDGTMDVLAPYADRLAYLVSEKDKGQSDAIHRGFARCTGEIMAYLNSDDMLSPGTLHLVARLLRRPPGRRRRLQPPVHGGRGEPDAVVLDSAASTATGTMIALGPDPAGDLLLAAADVRQVRQRRPALRFAIDYDLFVRFMKAGAKFVRLNRFLGRLPRARRRQDQPVDGDGREGRDQRRVEEVRHRTPTASTPTAAPGSTTAASRRGEAFAHNRRQLPGCLPGVGYDYNDVWGGLLDEPGLPPVGGGAKTSLARA